MNVDIFDENRESLVDQEGELVCKTAFPSMPIKFWNDKNGKNIKRHILKSL